MSKSASNVKEEYREAICPGCGVVLTGSREPGDRSYCQKAETEVTLAPVNKNVDAHHVSPYDGKTEFPSKREAIRGAIRKSRNEERVAVEMPLSYPRGYRFPEPKVVIQNNTAHRNN